MNSLELQVAEVAPEASLPFFHVSLRDCPMYTPVIGFSSYTLIFTSMSTGLVRMQ
jgi:hypothetical protein